MTPELERRYARLLLLYPAAYRRGRGTELLATLAESAEDDRRWPAPREVRALVLGGLRARAGDDRRTPGDGWPVVFRAAALMLLVQGTTGFAIELLTQFGAPSPYPPSTRVESVLALALAVGAILAAGHGRYREASGAASAALVISMVAASRADVPVHSGLWEFPLAVVLMLPLVWRPPAPVTGLLWYAPALPLVLVLGDAGLGALLPAISGIIGFGLFVAFCAVGLLWLAVDERLTMAMGLFLLNTLLAGVVFLIGQSGVVLPVLMSDLVVYGVVPLMLVGSAVVAGRRRARI